MSEFQIIWYKGTKDKVDEIISTSTVKSNNYISVNPLQVLPPNEQNESLRIYYHRDCLVYSYGLEDKFIKVKEL